MKIVKHINDMKIGEQCYTLPWALELVRRGTSYEGFLRSDYPAKENPSGTVCMRVVRRLDTFHVYPPANEEYDLMNNHSALYDLPVVIHEDCNDCHGAS